MYSFVDAWIIVYEGENNAQETAAEGGTGVQEGSESTDKGQEQDSGSNKEGNKAKVTPPKTFTQDDVNRIVETEKKKFQTNRQNLLTELKQLRETANLTQEQKDQLESRIEQIQNETITTQEQAKREKEKLVKDYTKQLSEKETQTNFWKGKYASEKIDRELGDAAIENESADPTGGQIVELLRPKSKLVEELKDGKPTGEWQTKVTLREAKEDGTIVTLELSPSEAVKRMKEDSKNWNLFKSTANGGLGSFNVPNQGSTRGKTPPTDPVAYKQWRKENIPTRLR